MKIVLFFDCDEWKSCASMRFICAARIEEKEKVLKQIQNARDYTAEEMERYIYIEETELL